MHAKKNMIISYIFILYILPIILVLGLEYGAKLGYLPKIKKDDLLMYINIGAYILLPIVSFTTLGREFSSSAKNMDKHILKIIPLIILLYCVSILGAIAIINLDHTDTTANQALIKEMQSSNIYFTTYMSVFAAPVAEESVFRYSIISSRGGFMSFLTLIISSALFSLIHLQGGITPGAFIAYGLIGLTLGLIYIKYRNLVLNILVHGGYNAISMLIPVIFKNYL